MFVFIRYAVYGMGPVGVRLKKFRLLLPGLQERRSQASTKDLFEDVTCERHKLGPVAQASICALHLHPVTNHGKSL